MALFAWAIKGQFLLWPQKAHAGERKTMCFSDATDEEWVRGDEPKGSVPLPAADPPEPGHCTAQNWRPQPGSQNPGWSSPVWSSAHAPQDNKPPSACSCFLLLFLCFWGGPSGPDYTLPTLQNLNLVTGAGDGGPDVKIRSLTWGL